MPVITRRKEQCRKHQHTGQGIWSAAERLERKTTTLAVRKVAKAKKRSGSSDGLRKWFGHNKGMGWVNCKNGGPCGRKSKKSGVLNLPVDLRWLNVKALKAKLQPAKRLFQRG